MPSGHHWEFLETAAIRLQKQHLTNRAEYLDALNFYLRLVIRHILDHICI